MLLSLGTLGMSPLLLNGTDVLSVDGGDTVGTAAGTPLLCPPGSRLPCSFVSAVAATLSTFSNSDSALPASSVNHDMLN